MIVIEGAVITIKCNGCGKEIYFYMSNTTIRTIKSRAMFGGIG